MRLLTSGWTDRHGSVALLVMVSSGACLTGLLDGGWVPWMMPLAVVVTVVISLGFDTWAGAAGGLGVAAAVVAVRRSLDAWRPEDFAPATGAVLALVVLGATAGFVGRQLRRGARPATAEGSLWEPVYGSLGLLGPEAAQLRLAEEVARAARTRRPLALAVIDVELADTGMSSEEGAAALRAVARLVENRAREHDVPFALAPERLGIVFPDSAASDAWDVVARIVASIATATFLGADDRVPRQLDHSVTLHAGISQHRHEQSWGTLLQDATAAVDRARKPDEVSTHLWDEEAR